MNIEITPGKFTNTWESLQEFECPQWFKDAKFGVWAHWGAQCVPEARRLLVCPRYVSPGVKRL